MSDKNFAKQIKKLRKSLGMNQKILLPNLISGSQLYQVMRTELSPHPQICL